MNDIGRFLSVDDVVLEMDVRDSKAALEEVAGLVERRRRLASAPIFRALWRREQIGSTGVGHGIAIPHARIAGISEPIVLVVRTKLPIAFGAPDHEPVSLLFVILVPEQATEQHLQILAAVSEMFSSQTFRKQLEASVEPAAIQRLFSQWRSGNGRTGDPP